MLIHLALKRNDLRRQGAWEGDTEEPQMHIVKLKKSDENYTI